MRSPDGDMDMSQAGAHVATVAVSHDKYVRFFLDMVACMRKILV